jgi:ubiquinone/menaquinone biosynthesis C-methylase UbiE
MSVTADEQLKEKEQHFHDEWALSIDPREVMVDQSWQAVTCPEHQWIARQLGDVRGKKVLDVGCGAGEAAVWFAKQGAAVVASDLSPEFLTLVERVADLHGVKLTTHVADADRMDFPDNHFDIVYAGNVLHHVDTARTLEQLARILKPGGRIVTWDPLKHNPAINIYRRMAMGVRTEDEHPLHIRDVRMFSRWFTDVNHECFWFCTLWIFLRFFLIERVHPSKERYWKKIIREHERLTPIYNRWARVDRAVLGTLPILKRYCWNVAVCATKPDA